LGEVGIFQKLWVAPPSSSPPEEINGKDEDPQGTLLQ
jgi:hypothetical protein